MKTKTYVKRLAAAAVMGLTSLSAANAAEDTIKFGMCYDLSKSYTFVTPQITQAAQDLATLTNMKGGIGGHEIKSSFKITATNRSVVLNATKSSSVKACLCSTCCRRRFPSLCCRGL